MMPNMLNSSSKSDGYKKDNDSIQSALVEVRKCANTTVPLGRVVIACCLILPMLVQLYESTGVFDLDSDMEYSYEGDRHLSELPSVRSSEDKDPRVKVDFGKPAFEPACKDFFSLMTNGAWNPPPDDSKQETNQTCADVYNQYDTLFAAHDEHMKRMGKTLHLFTTWPEEEFNKDDCNLDQYTSIKVQQFDPEQLLIRGGLTEQELHWVKHWKDAEGANRRLVVTRLADLFRLFLAKEYNYAYTDTDMLHLIPQPEVYLNVPNIAAPIWGEEAGALEIQNSGWCLTSEQLEVMIDMARERMRSKGEEQIKVNSYYYTELGPNLLQHALPWMQTVGDPIRLYYTVSDKDYKPDEHIVDKFDFYKGFVWLHIDKSMRLRMGIRSNDQRKLAKFIRVFRRKCKTPTLEKLRIPGLDLSKIKNVTIPAVMDKNGKLEDFPPRPAGNGPVKRRGWKKRQQAELLKMREEESETEQQSKEEEDRDKEEATTPKNKEEKNADPKNIDQQGSPPKEEETKNDAPDKHDQKRKEKVKEEDGGTKDKDQQGSPPKEDVKRNTAPQKETNAENEKKTEDGGTKRNDRKGLPSKEHAKNDEPKNEQKDKEETKDHGDDGEKAEK